MSDPSKMNLHGIVTFMGFELPTLEDGRIYISDNMVQKHRDHDWYQNFIARKDLAHLWTRHESIEAWVLEATAEDRAVLEDRFKFPERYQEMRNIIS